MNYIKTQFDHDKLLKNINIANAFYNINIGGLILMTSKNTLDSISLEISNSFLPERDDLIGRYMGYRVVRDDSLALGEVKIYKEIG